MYVMTEKFGIINLNHYKRVDIRKSQKDEFIGWELYAVDASPVGRVGVIVIATFATKSDTEMALKSLFAGIKNDYIWHAEAFKKFNRRKP